MLLSKVGPIYKYKFNFFEQPVEEPAYLAFMVGSGAK